VVLCVLAQVVIDRSHDSSTRRIAAMKALVDRLRRQPFECVIHALVGDAALAA
jgi:hypothetical protein